MKVDHGFPICNCTSRIAYSSQSRDIILLLEKTILLQPVISPVHRSAPHSASSKLARLAKISSSNCWRQVGLPARGKGELAQVAELAGQKRWQHLVGEGWKGTTRQPLHRLKQSEQRTLQNPFGKSWQFEMRRGALQGHALLNKWKRVIQTPNTNHVD